MRPTTLTTTPSRHHIQAIILRNYYLGLHLPSPSRRWTKVLENLTYRSPRSALTTYPSKLGPQKFISRPEGAPAPIAPLGYTSAFGWFSLSRSSFFISLQIQACHRMFTHRTYRDKNAGWNENIRSPYPDYFRNLTGTYLSKVTRVIKFSRRFDKKKLKFNMKLLTDRQTDRQTDRGKPKTWLAEVRSLLKRVWMALKVTHSWCILINTYTVKWLRGLMSVNTGSLRYSNVRFTSKLFPVFSSSLIARWRAVSFIGGVDTNIALFPELFTV